MKTVLLLSLMLGMNSFAQKQDPRPVPCEPPSVSIAYPFSAIGSNPAMANQYARCKELAVASGDPKNYKCCVKKVEATPTPKPTETPKPTPVACERPKVLIPYPFSAIGSDPSLANQYAKCKELSVVSGDPKNYQCCVLLRR